MSRGKAERLSVGRRPWIRSAALRLLLAAILASGAVACRAPQKMANQPQFDPYERSNFYPDGMSARPLVAGTVARGELKEDEFLETGKMGGQLVNSFPFPVTAQTMARGRERFNIYCSPCHGRTGSGDGMIVQRGFRKPPSYHIDRLRTAPPGHFFDVMTNGFGAMPPYGPMIPARDRWAIAAYIRALQLSQNAPLAQLPPAVRAEAEKGGAR